MASDIEHTDEFHEKEALEIYNAVTEIIDGKCGVSVIKALSHAVFDCVTAGYPERLTQDDVVLTLAKHNSLIIDNLKLVFEKVNKAADESSQQRKH